MIPAWILSVVFPFQNCETCRPRAVTGAGSMCAAGQLTAQAVAVPAGPASGRGASTRLPPLSQVQGRGPPILPCHQSGKRCRTCRSAGTSCRQYGRQGSRRWVAVGAHAHAQGAQAPAERPRRQLMTAHPLDSAHKMGGTHHTRYCMAK